MKQKVFKTAAELEQARKESAAFPFVLVRELSRVWLGETEKAEIAWSEATELRFFSEHSELRFFGTAGRLRAVLLEDVAEDTCHDRTFPLAHNGAFGQELTVREYLDYDEDGQLYVKATRLKGWVK